MDTINCSFNPQGTRAATTPPVEPNCGFVLQKPVVQKTVPATEHVDMTSESASNKKKNK